MDGNDIKEDVSSEANVQKDDALVKNVENIDEIFKDTNMASDDTMDASNTVTGQGCNVIEDDDDRKGLLAEDSQKSMSVVEEKEKETINDVQPMELELKEYKTAVPTVKTIQNNSLSLLAQYSSDSSSSSKETSGSDSDSSTSKSSTANAFSSDNESSSTSSTAKSKQSLTEIKKKIEELDEAESVLDEEDGDGKIVRTPIKAAGELGIEDLPPIEDLHISMPEKDCIFLGKITSIVDQLVLVESLPNIVPLDLDTVLFLEKGQRPLGKIFDVMGQVHCPIYCVRFNSKNDIDEKGILIGLDVYCAPAAPCTSVVILPNLLKQKGSDASWKNDIEPPDRYLDYSDDEDEKNARRVRKGLKPQPEQPTIPHRAGPVHHKPRRGHGRTFDGANSHHASHNYPRPSHHRMPIPSHMHQQPQYYFPPPALYPNPYAGPRFYVNPFACSPNHEYPAYNPVLFNGPPPPPPPPSE